MISRRLASLLLLALPAVAACDDQGTVTRDSARLISASGPRVVVAASSETETPSLGCGGGGDPQLGPSVLFVSDDSGVHFDRVMPDDARPLTRIGVKDGVFYGIAQDAGAFSVVTSGDGRTWTQVATKQGEPHDLSITTTGLAVAHSTGVLTSSDGTTWVDHPMTEGLYAPSVAQVGERLVVATAADGTLRIGNGTTWSTRRIPSMTSIWELIPAGDALLATGTLNRTSGDTAFTIARIDLSSDSAPTFGEGYTTHPVITPAGLLDTSGNLAPINATGVGTLAPFVEPFESAMVDGNRVQLLRGGKVTTSTDGGRTFGAPVALPIVSIEE
ncbi:hypothetical protein BH11MYX3_BH11MYX3_44440 [soil metagenome]